MMTELAELKIGAKARVIGYDNCSKQYRQKLLSMGLTRGAMLHVVRKAPLGDPIQISVRGFALSLRQHEARALKVEQIND